MQPSRNPPKGVSAITPLPSLVALKSVASHQQSQESQTREDQRKNLSDFAPLNLCARTTKAAELVWNQLRSCQGTPRK